MSGPRAVVFENQVVDVISQTRCAVERVSECLGPRGCYRGLLSPESLLSDAMGRGQVLQALVKQSCLRIQQRTAEHLCAELQAVECEVLGLTQYLRSHAADDWTLRAAIGLGLSLRRLRRAVDAGVGNGAPPRAR